MTSPSPSELAIQVAALLDAKKYAEAIPLLRSMEERGDRSARVQLGLLCARELGVPSDVQAIPWLRAAAEDNDKKAMLQLAGLLADAPNPVRDLKEAQYWLARLENDTDLLRRLCLEAANAKPAARHAWLRKGARHGSLVCMRLLAEEVIETDTGEAFDWLRKAADLGDAAAAQELARLHLEARSVPTDPWSALFWHREAASRLQEAADSSIVEALRARAMPEDALALATRPAIGPPVTLMVSFGWKVDRGGVMLNESGFVHGSLPCSGQPIKDDIYRITREPQYCMGVAQDDLVAVCRGYGGRSYVAERVRKSGKAHIQLIAKPDQLGAAGWTAFYDGLNALGVSFNIPSESIAGIEITGGPVVLTRNSPAALLPLIEYLDNWGWEIEWHYLDPPLNEWRSAYPLAPEPDSHPWPPKSLLEWPDDVTRFTFSVPRSPITMDCVATRPKEGIYEIILPPFRARGISAGDRYASSGAVWRFSKPPTEKSLNRTLWISCEFIRLKSNPLFRTLTEMGCALSAHTGADRNVCVTVPTSIPLDAVVAQLTSQRNAGRRFKAWLCDPAPEREIA